MAEFDLVILGGTIVDGRRNPRYISDLGIKDGRIAAIGRLEGRSADRTIDASGRIVAPGIIDLHTHYDSQLFWDPYCSTSGWHGITSVVIGNCGFGFAPVRPEERDRSMLTMTRNEAVPLVCMQQGMPWDWETFPEFLDSIERTPKAVNILALVPLNPLMIYVMGTERAKAGELPTDEEHAEMARLLNEAMDAGAYGFSAQRMGAKSVQRDYDGTPMATDIMHDETMICLAKVLGERNEGIIEYTYHDVGALLEGDPDQVMVNKVQPHIEEIARISRRPIILQGTSGTVDPEWIRDCQERGLRLYVTYLTTGLDAMGVIADLSESVSSFDVAVSWNQATVGELEEVKAKLADPAVRDSMRADLWLMEATFGALKDWVIARAVTPKYSGYSQWPLGKVAEELGYDDLLDCFCDINIYEDLKTRWYREFGGTRTTDEQGDADSDAFFGYGLEPYKKIAEDPVGIPGVSDGGAHTKYMTTGNFGVHYLINFVRKHGWTTLEDAHYKLGALSAFAAGITDRGALELGAWADIIIYDYDALDISEREEATDYPGGEWRIIDRPIGLDYVITNGVITMENNNELGTSPGVLLRHGHAPVETVPA